MDAHTGPWDSARDHFEHSVLPRLRMHGSGIGAAARSGDEAAAEVVRRYTLLSRSFDPVTAHLLEEALDAFLSTAVAKEA